MTTPTEKKKANITTKQGNTEVRFSTGHDLWIKLRKEKNSPSSFML